MKKLPLWKRPLFAQRVLEIGGGHDPYYGVTHAVDKFPENNAQRGGNFVLPSGAKFYEGDLEALPFGENESFDFIYASHVFEHVTNPQKAAAELNRVGNKGYIETPSPLREQLACPLPYDKNDFHTLFCWSKNGEFHCVQKTESTVAQFPDTRTGRIAKKLFHIHRDGGLNLEPLLSRRAKTTEHFFSGGFRLREHKNFLEAAAAGCCAYEASVSAILQDITFPFSLASPRFLELKARLDRRLPT